MGSYLFLAIMLVITWWLKRNFATIKGEYGEKQVSKQLKKLDPKNYILLNDLYIPKKNGSTTQIDHILISHKGLFIIETKNYNGWIMGSENSQYWTQVIYKRKEKFYNPIWQNSGHIKALQEYLGVTFNDVPIYSVIVFGKQATLKFNKPFTKAKVIKSEKLLSIIEDASETHLISHSKRQGIKQLLSFLYINDKKEQKRISKKHISDIKQNVSNLNNKIQMNVCPRCGGKLVTRKGKNGEFKGCSNFPKCRFTA